MFRDSIGQCSEVLFLSLDQQQLLDFGSAHMGLVNFSKPSSEQYPVQNKYIYIIRLRLCSKVYAFNGGSRNILWGGGGGGGGG